MSERVVVRVGDLVVWEFALRIRESKVAAIRRVGQKLQWKVGFWPHSIWSGDWMPIETIKGRPLPLREAELP